MIGTLLIANRGEIALRIVRAARELGIRSVMVHSEADINTMAVQLADEAHCIGGARASESYLDIDAVLGAACASGADAVHPGYGFLSESAEFARRVTEAGLIFVGPDASIIERMGNKAMARNTAIAAGVPVVPGSQGSLATLEEALEVAEEVGYPLMIKASAGGGGRGIRIANTPDELTTLFPQARGEAEACFGNGDVYLERFIGSARHIEVQILGDGVRAVHLFERECSLQRRRQKIFEESPSPALDAATREQLCQSAVALAEYVNYFGAGTLEYLYDDMTGECFFIEMNTRIQVEHPITEMVTGIDLVREMLLMAGGQPLRLHQSEIILNGWAVEMRINAEDPARQFFPCPGEVKGLRWPTGPGIRIESGLYPGYRVPPYYDSLVAKLVVWDTSRAMVLRRALQALEEFQLEGFITTASLHQRLLQDPEVAAGRFDTQFLERWLALPAERTATEVAA
ncbi:acetyl-CoA carboxylase biotin carboxylase subunit [Cobetia sp. L2A1]|uniref:acetyl-CoA carboxylase biotin carboxylase subunit n=1 Tax=Cobetia sp. L2A1 TaxID=2686360 RepID=UPI00131C88AE|nr:acetyl-CoA carboxylase biotin carboxylase subunit [Cobetia sp. L2A1]